jgi:hypothetical protein
MAESNRRRGAPTYNTQGSALVLTVYSDAGALLDRQAVVKLLNNEHQPWNTVPCCSKKQTPNFGCQRRQNFILMFTSPIIPPKQLRPFHAVFRRLGRKVGEVKQKHALPPASPATSEPR